MKKYTTEFIRNTTDKKILAEILRRGRNNSVSWYAVLNPHCPPEILTEVLRREKDDIVSCYAAENPNCPPEVLVEVLRRGKDDGVSWYASSNPNCPPEAIQYNKLCVFLKQIKLTKKQVVELFKKYRD